MSLPAIVVESEGHDTWMRMLDEMRGWTVEVFPFGEAPFDAELVRSDTDPSDGFVGVRMQPLNDVGDHDGPQRFLRCDEFAQILVY